MQVETGSRFAAHCYDYFALTLCTCILLNCRSKFRVILAFGPPSKCMTQLSRCLREYQTAGCEWNCTGGRIGFGIENALDDSLPLTSPRYIASLDRQDAVRFEVKTINRLAELSSKHIFRIKTDLCAV